MADGSIKIDTKIDTTGLDKQIGSLKTSLQKGIAIAAKASGVAMAGLTVAFGAATVAAKKFADETGRIADMSQALGMSKKGFQELSYALKLSGSSIDSMQMGMKSLMEKAQAGGKEFEKLGVSVRNADGSLRDQESILRETISAFQRMENGTEKAMLAQDLFSRSGQELMPMLNAEAGNLEELTKRANDLGFVMSDKTIAAGEALGDALDELAIAGSTLLNNVFAPFAGVVQKVAEWITTLSSKISTAVTMHTDLGRETNTLITATTNYKTAVENLDSAQKDITDTERTLLTGRKELARLALQTALAETSKGYASTREEIAKLEAKEAEHIKNLEKQSALMKQLDVVANGPPAAALAASQALGISIESAQKAYGVAAKNFESENQKLIKLQTELGTINVEYTETIAQLGRAVNDGTLNIEIYKTTNKALYDEIMATAEAQKTLNEAIKDAPAGAKPSPGSATLASSGSSPAEATSGLVTDVSARITTAMILAQNELDRQAKLLKLKEAGRKAALDLVTGFAKSVASNTVRATVAIKNLVSNTASAIISGAQLFGKMVRFDFNAALADLDTFLQDVNKFFAVTIPALPTYFTAGLTMIQNFLNGMMQNLPQIVTWMTNALNEVSAIIIQYGPQIIDNAGTIVIALITGLVAAAPQLIQAALTLINSLATFVLENLPEIILLGVQLVVSLINGIAQALPTLIQTLVDNLPAILDAIITAFPLIVQAIADNLPMIIEAVLRAIPMIAAALIAATPETLLAILSMASSIAQGLFEGIVAGIKGLFLGIGDVMIAYVNTPILDAMKEITHFGEYIISGLVSGIVGFGKGIWDGIKSVFTGVVDSIKSFFGIHSPSTLFSGFGVDMIQGLINGLLSAGAVIWNAVSGVFTGLWENIKNVFAGAYEFGKGIVKGIENGINNVANTVVGSAQDLYTMASNAASDAAGAVVGAAQNLANDPVGTLQDFGGSVVSGASNVASNVGSTVSGAASFVGSAVSSGLSKLKFWASGTNSAPAGLSIVGEKGPELVQMGGGERVYPANITERIMSGLGSFAPGLAGAGGITIHNLITAPVMIDGRQTAKAVYENWDKVNR